MPLRPFVKLLSAVFLPLPPFSRATGDGLKALPGLHLVPAPGGAYASSTVGVDMTLRHGVGAGSSHGSLASSGTVDPVAERRRERALRALDKKLAELRTNMRGGGASAGALAVPSTPQALSNAGSSFGGQALIPMPPTPLQAQPATSASDSNGGPSGADIAMGSGAGTAASTNE